MDDIKNRKLAIASRLALARKNAGLSQGQVAKIIKVHRPTISEIEAGRRNVSSEELVDFSKIYSVNIGWLASKDNEVVNPRKDEIELAARELAKLKKEDLEKVIKLLSSLRKCGDSN